jgi:hypothetical protein
MPTQVAKDTVHFTLRDGSRVIARTSERTDREIVRQFRIECGWDEDKVDDWFDMVDEGLRLQYMAIGEDGAPVGMIALDLEVNRLHVLGVCYRFTAKMGIVYLLFYGLIGHAL